MAPTDLDANGAAVLGQEDRALKKLLPNLNVLGGCCSTGHRHVQALAAAFTGQRRRPEFPPSPGRCRRSEPPRALEAVSSLGAGQRYTRVQRLQGRRGTGRVPGLRASASIGMRSGCEAVSMRRGACIFAALLVLQAARAEGLLVLQSDFGTRDGAVAAMKGVAASVSSELAMHDLTHHIEPYDIWEGALRLAQAAPYWPEGTVFVSVVDPGVGTGRQSVVMRSRSGHYFVTPDNGTLTFVAEELGIDAVREIDEAVNRRAGSERSYTFHGRDVYAYTGARLASGTIDFDDVGPELPSRVVSIPYQHAAFDDGILRGSIPILDVRYGNVWTNIDRATFARLDLGTGERARVRILHEGRPVYAGAIPYYPTFGQVAAGEPLLYLNSLDNVALALNQASFAARHGIASGAGWTIEITHESER